MQPVVARAPRVGAYYGDVFAFEPVGPGFTKRHDALKHTLQNVLDWAKIRHVLEVYNLFAALIPQQGLARLESDSKKQGLVPDFHIIAGQGLTMEGLAELKFIGRCPSHYMYPGAPGDNPTAANCKAHTFQALYEKKAADVDHADGRVLQRLRSLNRQSQGPGGRCLHRAQPGLPDLGERDRRACHRRASRGGSQSQNWSECSGQDPSAPRGVSSQIACRSCAGRAPVLRAGWCRGLRASEPHRWSQPLHASVYDGRA